jgi:hypothetical protein
MVDRKYPIMPESRSKPLELNEQGNYRSPWRGQPKGPIQKPNGSLASFGENENEVLAGEKITPRPKSGW